MKKTFLLILLTIVSNALGAQTVDVQDSQIQGNAGLDLQVYPTGIILMARYEHPIREHSAIAIRAGINLIDHRDLGVQDDEKGSGAGFSLDYRYYFKQQRGLFAGANCDLWFNKIQWKSQPGTINESSGTTHITVVQPTVEGGYAWVFLRNRFVIAPYLSFGVEINAVTKGAEVGQGAIFLIGVSTGWRF